MNLFGKKKAQPKPAIPDSTSNSAVDTIKLLRERSGDLEKREAHIQKRMDACLKEAKEKAAKKDKKGSSMESYNPLFVYCPQSVQEHSLP